MSEAASALAAGNADQGAAGAADAAGAAAAPNTPWHESAGIDAQYAPAIAAKGWGGVNDILESYTNVEKLVSLERGGDVDRIMVRPKDDATPEEVAAFRQKAGLAAPAEAKDYGLGADTVASLAGELFAGSGLSPEAQQTFTAEMAPVVEKATEWFKQAGRPAEFAAPLVKAVLADEVKGLTEYSSASDREYQTLSQQMGDKFGDFEENGRRAFRVSGLEPAALEGIERAIGTAKMMQMFGKFGQALGEASAPQPGRTGGGQFTTTAEGAQGRIQTLGKDSDFQAKLLSTNPQVRGPALKEWEELHKTAYPA